MEEQETSPLMNHNHHLNSDTNTPHVEEHHHKITLSTWKFVLVCVFEVLQVSLVLLLLITYYVDAIYFGYKESTKSELSGAFPLSSNSTTAQIVEYLYNQAHPPKQCVPTGEHGAYYLAISELVSITIYIIYIVTGVARIGVFLGTLYHLVKTKLTSYLFVLDSLFALGLVMCLSYIGFVPSLSFPAPSASDVESIPKLCPEADALIPLIVTKQLLGYVCMGIFCLAIFTWNGMFRALTSRVHFTKGMILAYKWIRVYGACLNIIVAVLVLKSNQVFEGYELGGKNGLFDYELFLLFIVNAVVYLLEMYFHVIKHVDTNNKHHES